MINFSDIGNLNNLIMLEQSSLNSTLTIQKTLNVQILTFIKSCIGNVTISMGNYPSDLFVKYINKSSYILNKSNSNIFALKKLIKSLDDLISESQNLTKKEIAKKVKDYNVNFSDDMKSIYDNTKKIELFLHKISLIDLKKLVEKFNENSVVNDSEIEDEAIISSFELDRSFIENTLVISELQQKVILPYNFEEIKNLFLDKNNGYSSIYEVIDKLYTIPIKNYRFPLISRFKEAYNLVIKKEHGSAFKAFSLALELSVNYNLHPAIITACKNLDELDIYLACLETNTLYDFNYFDIKYEVPPTVLKNAIE